MENIGMSSFQDPHPSRANVSSAKMMKEPAALTKAIDFSPIIAECASCSDRSKFDELVKVSCEHISARNALVISSKPASKHRTASHSNAARSPSPSLQWPTTSPL